MIEIRRHVSIYVPEAAYELAKCYMYGEGVRQNVMKSFILLKQAVYQGFEIPESFMNDSLITTQH